tara:strand:- start:31 stop:504 length:474 start_codon:yes stop_codon:yes gene_type:complete
MKIYKKYLGIILLLIILVISCEKEKSNYNYDDLNKVGFMLNEYVEGNGYYYGYYYFKNAKFEKPSISKDGLRNIIPTSGEYLDDYISTLINIFTSKLEAEVFYKESIQLNQTANLQFCIVNNIVFQFAQIDLITERVGFIPTEKVCEDISSKLLKNK